MGGKDNAAVTGLKHTFCGAMAGAITKTSVAPLERVKIIMQVHGMKDGGTAEKLGIMSTARVRKHTAGCSNCSRCCRCCRHSAPSAPLAGMSLIISTRIVAESSFLRWWIWHSTRSAAQLNESRNHRFLQVASPLERFELNFIQYVPQVSWCAPLFKP